ncbi:MAG: hypothetical protein K1X70_09675 [Leptospirales bacterium]|nr:hypothetical protein [Leptospirales bacterium]
MGRKEFDRAAESDSDYMNRNVLRSGNIRVAWDEAYERVSGAAEGLIRTALELGCTVVRSARLTDLANATGSNYDTVVLFSHWRGAFLEEQDIIGDLDVIRDRLPEFVGVEGSSGGANQICKAMNRAIQDGTLLSRIPDASIVNAGRSDHAIGKALARDILDEVLSGLVIPGNRIELGDGCHSPLAFASAVGESFRGVLDLAMCNSVILGTFLDLRTQNKIRHLHWPDLLLPAPQMTKVEAALRLMEAEGLDYVSARLWIEEQEQNGAIANERDWYS